MNVHQTRRCALLTILFIFCVGCGPQTPKYDGPIGGSSGTELAELQHLRKSNGAEPQTLDPHRAEGVPASNILRDLFEGLVIEAPDGTLIPGVAESWSMSDDGRVYEFQIRESARWSNGDPLTAKDFVYGLRRTVDPQTLSNYSTILSPIENAMAIIRGELPPDELGVAAPDIYLLRITLNDATPYFLGLLTHSTTYPLHAASVELNGTRFTRAGNLVGNGAYVLDEWVVQSHMRLKRNSHYWNDAATTVDNVTYYPLENQDAALKRYRADALDFVTDVPLKQLQWVRD
ncbi:MAG: peptide ABC transporter substrate-binding protein, partial [Gammaproteobacteria bacterium]